VLFPQNAQCRSQKTFYEFINFGELKPLQNIEAERSKLKGQKDSFTFEPLPLSFYL